MSELASIRATCTPRADVLAGGLVDKHFAAQLDQVVRGAAGYEAYADAERFFELTFPTKGLRDLLTGTFARLSGRPDATPSAEHAVYRYETSFGGGKTHGLIALWHLASGARPANVAEFVDPALLPERCATAAVVGDHLDPIAGVRGGAGDPDGVITWTLWGEIARQLGPEAWARMAAHDEARTSCGKQVWLDIFAGAPTLIIVDELAQYLRRLGTSGDPAVRHLAGATIDALKVLFEAATAAPAVRIVFTLATGTTAFGKETIDVGRALTDMAARTLQEEAADVMARPMGAVGRPADDHEIGHILRRRLFEEVDGPAAADAAGAYRDLYANLAARGVGTGAATDDPAGYAGRLEAAYPFHPALIDCLDKRIGPLPGFQRARGALKMLAESVQHLWSGGGAGNLAILNLGDLPLEARGVRASVTSSVGREALDGPAVADFASPSSHAAGLDGERWPQDRRATRACRTVFLHSVAGEPTPGASLPDVYAGTLRPGEDPDAIDEALAATAQRAWHLTSDGARWRLQIAPNANRIIAAEVENVRNSDVTEELDRRIRDIFRSDGTVQVIHAPTSPADVADEAELRLAVFSHADVTHPGAATPPPPRVLEVFRFAGAAEGNRTFRNSVVALVADGGATERMRELLRFELAASRILNDSERLAGFDRSVVDALRKLAGSAKLDTRVAVCRAYRHLWWPARNPAGEDLKHFELPPRDQGQVKGSQTGVVLDALKTHGKVSDTAPPTDRLATRSGFSRSEEIATAALAETPWRDHTQPIPINPTAVNDAIVAGVRNGTWVYYDAQRRQAHTAESPPASVRIAGDAWLYSLRRAGELGVGRKPVSVAQVAAVLDSAAGRLDGTALLNAVGGRGDSTPTEDELLAALAAGVRAGGRFVVVESPAGSGSKPLRPDEIGRRRAGGLVALTHAAAAEAGISADVGAKSRIVEGDGSVGVALQQVIDGVTDRGGGAPDSVKVTATADMGEGPRDLRLLGFCIPQLPRFECEVSLRISVTFGGLDGGLRAELRGSAGDYQQVEAVLLAAAEAGADVSGSLELGLTPPAPMSVDSADWQQLRSVLESTNPGRVLIAARLTHPDASGSTPKAAS